MANSTLHLTVDKGPKRGETLSRNPGALIRIGRVVRGNTFAIKDPAISQKHLIIEFSSEISRWTIKDLDTSNGTIVNDANVPSLEPFPLSDGDIVKIGETTSMSVKIDDVGSGGEAEGGLRRGRRRGARSRVVEEEEDDDFVEAPKNLGRGRTRRGNSSRVSKKDEVLDTVLEDSVEVRPRRAVRRRKSLVH
ncbi:uncharacterized protein A4U43_C07F12730 [Asparagus officinalis]|uniref:FHA domain-containing protein n=1 Tax=Asparagus officinalis TaxID=4686 RepID=A0A5P1EGP5_ASPOF|nr:uncharacterized protein A4U43_C07F12730 [Asparagus officinalis]